ncbi:OprO/OprP family phosphate-selective porin [Methylophaga nitratireducenticrescens]|uniref:Phosphate-selective porin O and P n=1 Tax=Methylophaga nitratireducenticrescens TaxID=754476 RepID=I1XGY9_METNJ|nr:porin [Methylophaga nitratireducenticrescens]AFI83658.1 porin [Methylophaga nitratireducenticrescens]AUZ83756.1 porin [Methylophaga nitratireducenticrescens]
MRFKKHLLTAAIGLTLSFSSHASELETLINMLHENGMVTDEQYGRLMNELAENKASNEQQKAELDEKLADATKPSDVEISTNGGLTLKTRDGQFSTKVGGRLQVDAATYGGSPDMGDGTDIRRARLYLAGTLYRDWGYKLEYEFDNDSITDAFITYNGFENYQIMAGNFKDPFSLDYMISANNTMFMERALPTAFNAGRHIGVMGARNSKHWTLAAALMGDTVNDTRDADDRDEDEGWGWSTRGTLAPINEAGKVVHLGLGFNYRDLQPNNEVRFSQASETSVSSVRIVDTDDLANADTMLKSGLEFATVMGPFTAQAEYIRASVERDNISDADFDGWYLQSSYLLTGESRPYKNGVFGGIKPNRRVGDGGIGAWEVAMRYSSLDLNDGAIEGGEADSMTLGLNWYPVPMLRFSANYVHVLDVDGGTFDGQEPDVFQVRSQWAF